MKETKDTTDVSGESFASCISEGYKTYPETSNLFHRGLPFIEARNRKVKGVSDGEYRDYDETNTVNQG